MICFDKVNKFILSDITLHIPQGKTVGLIGMSGAGKTTFLKLAGGLLLPDAGEVYTMGKKSTDIIFKRSDCRRLMSVFFADKQCLNNEDTVKQNFEILSAVYRLSATVFRRDYEEISGRLGFAQFERETVRDLSLGQRRRAELGAMLLPRPKLLLLDEPASGLDERVKSEFRTLLAERKKAENMTVVISSHDCEEIFGMCDRFAFLHEGRVMFYGEKDILRRSFLPQEELILKVSGAMPDLEDLPLDEYCFDGKELRMVYRTDFVSAADILQLLMRKCSVTQVQMSRPGLEKIITGQMRNRNRRKIWAN